MQASRSVRITHDRLPDAESWLNIMLGILQYVFGATSHRFWRALKHLSQPHRQDSHFEASPCPVSNLHVSEQGPKWRCTAQLFRATWHTCAQLAIDHSADAQNQADNDDDDKSILTKPICPRGSVHVWWGTPRNPYGNVDRIGREFHRGMSIELLCCKAGLMGLSRYVHSGQVSPEVSMLERWLASTSTIVWARERAMTFLSRAKMNAWLVAKRRG